MSASGQHKDLINRLVTVALTAMEEIQVMDDLDDTVLLSASYSLALRVTDAAIERNPELRTQCTQGAQLLLMRCAKTDPN